MSHLNTCFLANVILISVQAFIVKFKLKFDSVVKCIYYVCETFTRFSVAQEWSSQAFGRKKLF